MCEPNRNTFPCSLSPLQGSMCPLQPPHTLSFLLLQSLTLLILKVPIFFPQRSTQLVMGASLPLVCCTAHTHRCPWLVPVLLPTWSAWVLQGISFYKHLGRWSIARDAARQGCSLCLCFVDAASNTSGQCRAGSSTHSLCGVGSGRFPMFALWKTLSATQ